MLQFPVISNSALKFYSILIQLNYWWNVETMKTNYFSYILMYKDGRMS